MLLPYGDGSLSILLGIASMPIVTLYPFMKRYTHWPQSVLGTQHALSSHCFGNILHLFHSGLAFNWGALLGFAAVAETVNWSVAVPLYAGGVCWTLVYDTIYAHQVRHEIVDIARFLFPLLA